MAAGSEDLVLKISADTSAVAAGLAPMTTALTKLDSDAGNVNDQLSKLDGLKVAPTVDDAGLTSAATALANLDTTATDASDTLNALSRDKVSPPVDASKVDELTTAAKDAAGELGSLADPVSLSVRDQALIRAQERIEELKDQIAEDVSMGVDTRDALREMSTLERSVNELTEDPQTIDVEVNPEDADFAFESMAKLKRGVRSLTDAVISAGDGLKALPDLVSAGVGSFTTLNASMSSFLEKQAQIGKGATPLATGLGKVTGFLAGPWGLAIAGGVTVLGAMIGKINDADEATKDFAKSLDYQTDAMDKNNRMKVATKLADEGVLEAAQKLGLSTEDIVTGLLEQKDIYDALSPAQAAHLTDLNLATQGYDDNRKAIDTVIGKYRDLTPEMNGAAEDQERLNTAVGAGETIVHDSATAVEFYSDAVEDAQTALDKLIGELDIFNGRAANTREATADYEAGLDALREAITKGTKTLKLSTPEGRANDKLVRDQAKNIAALTEARLADAAESGESTDKILADYKKQRAGLVESMVALGMSETAAENYVDALLDTPKEVKTKATVTGVDAAETELERLAKEREAVIKASVELNRTKFDRLPKRIQDAISGNGSVNITASVGPAPAAPAPAPRGASTVFLQPRLYLDSRPIRSALRGDVDAAVSSSIAATRHRGRL